MTAATRNAFACFRAFWLSTVFLAWFLSTQVLAIEAPLQTDFPYFEDDRWAQTVDLNGRTFDAGFTFSGWFYVKKFRSDQEGIAGYGADTFRIDMEPNGNITIWFKEVAGTVSNMELDQWVNLAMTAGAGQVRFYKNGELVYQEALADTSVTFPQNEWDEFGLGGFWGYVKQLKIWDAALSQQALQAEIAVASSKVNVPVHQWLMDEGVGSVIEDTGTPGGTTFNYEKVTIWKNVNSPYEILFESELHIYGEALPEDNAIPSGQVWGSADFDQDGVNEVFLHGGEDTFYPEYNIPMLVLQIDENQRLADVSDSLIDGGTYYKAFPTGRETVVADLNGDGFDDIFASNSDGHGGIIIPESSVYLLSDGASGKLFPSEHKIMSPPCTLTAPAYEGQKPCETSDNAGIIYPDENAPLVPMSIRDYGHSTSSGDIDRDGDIDLYVQTLYGFVDLGVLAVAPYFLINDGAGNFTANWQLVPHKAFMYDTERFQGGELNNRLMDNGYTFGKLSDFDQDGFLDLALLHRFDEGAEYFPPDDPFDVETDTPWTSLYELIAWGDENGFSEEYTILWPEELPATGYRITHTEPLAADIDNDGDEDLVVNRQNELGRGSWIQVFRNEGGRVFADVTAQSIPQTLEEISERPQPVSFEPHDLNQDGCTDFIANADAETPNFGGLPPYRIWLNDCRGRFTPVRDSLFGKVGMMIPLDIDGDGGLDFVSIVNNSDRNGIDGNYKEATILKQVAPIDISYFTDTNNFKINAGHAGAWFWPTTSGQGQFIDVEPNSQFMFIGWFTYTEAGSNNPNEQQWYTAQGDYSGNSAVLDLYETLGGKFRDPQKVTNTKVGTVMLEFDDCQSGMMSYQFDAGGPTGDFPLQRVISGSENWCQDLEGTSPETVDINPGMDGAWFDSNMPGQGFYFDVHTDAEGERFIFVSWFTYGDDTTSGQRWLTAQGDFDGPTAELDVHETTGGSFDDPKTTDTVKIGTMTIDFTDCNAAVLSYSLDDDGLEGEIDITRVVSGGQALCEELAGIE